MSATWRGHQVDREGGEVGALAGFDGPELVLGEAGVGRRRGEELQRLVADSASSGCQSGAEKP
jgi:hypothetical protein